MAGDSKLPINKLLILTHKNRTAVKTLCEHYGRSILDENLFSGDAGQASKTDNLHRICNSKPATRFTIVDDSIKNLVELDRYGHTHGVRLELLLAAWGYGGPDDTVKAERHGYRVIQQTDLIATMAP